MNDEKLLIKKLKQNKQWVSFGEYRYLLDKIKPYARTI